MIKEDYVSFEVAKLLKEKGFDEPCIGFYNPINGCFFESSIRKSWDYNKHGSINAPTLQMAMKWLREVHRIETHIVLSELNTNNSRKYMFDIYSSDIKRDFDSIQKDGFNSYEQAVEAAIKYVLENLI